LNAYYDSLKMKAGSSGASDSAASAPSSGEVRAEPPPAPNMPMGTVVLEVNAFDTKTENPPATPPKASLKILLPTGDVFDRELSTTETQIGKGPRNDIVIADPAVSTAHAMVRLEGDAYLLSDLGSRNGTFVNSERVTEPRPLRHGDVVGIGLSKLTFRFSDFSETGAIEGEAVAAAVRSSGPPPLTEESIARAVVSAGLVGKSDVDRLRADAKGRRLCRALVEERLAAEDALRDLMSKTFQMPVIDLSKVVIDEAIIGSFPGKVAREHHVFAALRDGEATVVAVADPTDTEAVKQIKFEIRSPLSIRLATFTQIREQLDRHYGPKLIGVLPSGEKLEYLIDKNEVEIGKASHNHITLTDPTVSNTHAIVISRDAGYSVVDLGSRNGTFINGERLGSQAHTLRHGDKVQLGQTVLTFRNPAETTANITAVLSGEALEEVRRRAGVPPLGAPKLAEGGKQSTLESVLEPQPPAVSPATPEVVETEEEKAERKKKKKKKKGGDERMRAAYISGLSRIVAQVLGVVLAVMLALYVNSSMRSGSEKPAIETTGKGKAKVKLELPGSGTPFQGGTFETSGAVYVPGSSGVLMVDDSRPGEVLWMQLDEAGRQVGSVKPVATGAAVVDPEGITTDGSYFYIVGSQAQPNDGDRNALVRFTFDAGSQTVTKAETMTNLRDFLLSSLPELNTGLKATEGGLMIEGIAWDFKRGRWLLGLRAPLAKDGSALLVAIKLRDPAGPFSVDNLQLAEPNVIPLKLAGLGIRDIQYDLESNSFLIISGAPENVPKSEFILWEWSGDTGGSETALRREQDLDPKSKPEGLTYVEAGGRRFVLVVCDASAYMKLDYAAETQ